MAVKKIAESIIQRSEALFRQKAVWKNIWQEVSDYSYPTVSNIETKRTRGEKRNQYKYTNRGVKNNRIFASGIYSYLIKGNWFKFRESNTSIMEEEDVQEFFVDVNRIIANELQRSNFNLEIHNSFQADGAFGISNVYTNWDNEEDKLSFSNIALNEYAIAENNNGYIDTVFRKFKFTARQAVQEFGKDNLPDGLVDLANSEKQDEKFEFIHAVYPRSDYDNTKADSKEKPFASIYICVDGVKLVSESGYDTMPYAVNRFYKFENEVYGRSPAMEALADLKNLDLLKKNWLKSVDMEVDPPWLVPDDDSTSLIRNQSGAIIYFNANRPNGKPERLPYEGRSQMTLEAKQEMDRVIDESFYIPLFQTLKDHRNMTATEVNERVEESITMIAPAIERIQNEKIAKIMRRAYGLLQNNGKLPIPPPILQEQGHGLQIDFLGKLSLVVEQLESMSVRDLVMNTMNIAQANQQVLDVINWDELIRSEAVRLNVPNNLINNKEELEQIRGARQEAMQKQQQAEEMSRMADVVSKTQNKTEDGSPLQQIQNELG